MNSLSLSPVLAYNEDWVHDSDRLKKKALTLDIPKSPPINAVEAPPSRGDVVLVKAMGGGRYPDIAHLAGRVFAMNGTPNLHDSGDEDQDNEEEAGWEEAGREEADQEEADEGEAVEEEADQEGSDQEEADLGGGSRGCKQDYVHLRNESSTGRTSHTAATDQLSSPRYRHRNLTWFPCEDRDQASKPTQNFVPRMQSSWDHTQAQAQSPNHRNPLPTLKPALLVGEKPLAFSARRADFEATSRAADTLDKMYQEGFGRPSPSTQHGQSEQPVRMQEASPAPGIPSVVVGIAAKALPRGPSSKPDPAVDETDGRRTAAGTVSMDGEDQHALLHAGRGERFRSSTPRFTSLGVPNQGLQGNDQIGQTDRGRSPHLALSDEIRPGLLSSHGASQRLVDQPQLLDPSSAMTRHTTPSSSSSTTQTSSRMRDDPPTAHSLAASSSSHSPNDTLSPYSPQDALQHTSPSQTHSSRQSLPPIQQFGPPHLDTNTTTASSASGNPIGSGNNNQPRLNLPRIHEVFSAEIISPSPHSGPVSPNDTAYSPFSPPGGNNYPSISRRATTDGNTDRGNLALSARDTLHPILRRAATTPKPPLLAPHINGSNGRTLHDQQPAVGQHPPPPAGGFVCPEPNCKALPFLTQYQLSSHANVHSTKRPHFCSVKDCPRSKPGKGFKRKNEMIRHGLVHSSPGYTCPFCPDRKHKYPRPDNLRRHVRGQHRDKDKDDPQLLDVLAQRPEGPSGRRRRAA